MNATDIHSDFDRTDAAWKVFGGFRLHRNVAIELSYADLGESRLATSLQGGTNPTLPAPTDRSRSTTQNETVFHWGVGADWDFTPNVAVRLEWERYNDV